MTSTQTDSSGSVPSQRTQRLGLTWLFLITLALFVVRVTGPSNLLDNDQERPAAYVMDAVLHGHWWCQTDWTGDIMSKPPLFTWIAALATLTVGHANLVSLYLPCLLAMGLTVALLFQFGRGPFGWAAGFLGGLMYLSTPSGVKHIALARTDALFAATIALTGFLGYRAWTTGRGWPWFWLAAALATLTKGPLGVVIGAMGLLAVFWKNWDARTVKRLGLRWNASFSGHLIGLVIFLAITCGWFWMAYRQSGQAFIDKVIGKELVGHMVGEQHGTFGIGFVKAPLYWLSRFLPWSLLALLGLWRLLRHPATEPNERRFERFLFCWMAGGLLLFSLATHQRGDLPLPLNAPAALLAGRELARWLRDWQPEALVRRSVAVVVLALACYTIYLHTVFARSRVVQQSEGIEWFAKRLAHEPGLPPMLYVDSPYALQFHLNTMDIAVSFEQAAAALQSHASCAVAVCNVDALLNAVGEPEALHKVASLPGEDSGDLVTVFSN